MSDAWSSDEVDRFVASTELEIATVRADGTLRRWLPIWVVCIDRQVYVRTWYRRETGWFGRAVRSRRARVRVPGLEADVTVEDVGVGSADLRADVDAAYAAKYGSDDDPSVGRMVTDEAAAATLRLIPRR